MSVAALGAWRRSARERWRELPDQTRRLVVAAVQVVIAVVLVLWIRDLGWGFAYVAGLLWTLKIDDDRLRWAIEAVMTVLSLIFLAPLGIITAAIFALQELPFRYRRWALPLGATAAAALYPFYVGHLFTLPVFGPFPGVSTGVVMIVFVMMAVGLNIVVGYAGLLDLGYVAFYAMGAYSAAWFASLQFPNQKVHFGAVGISPDLPGIHISIWAILAIAAILTAFAGVVIGLPTLRLRGDYLAIVTLGFGEILPQIARNGDNLFGTGLNLTNGPNGITPIDAPGFGEKLSSWSGGVLPGNYLTATNADRLFFWTALALVLITVFCSWRLRDSRLGRAWIAIREDEIAAGAMGIPLMRTKTWAYASGAFFGGIAGAYYATFKSATFPGDFFFNISVLILCMVILGGMGNIWGVILGAAFLEYLDREGLANTGTWLNDNFTSDSFNIFIAIVLVALCLYGAFVTAEFLLSVVLTILAIVAIVLFGVLRVFHFPIDVPLYASGIYGAIILIVMLLRPEGLIPDRRRTHELHEGVSDEPLYDATAQGA